MYIDKLAEIVNKYNNTYHITIKMKPADVKLRIYIYFKKENNKEDPEFEVGGHVRISTHKSIFAKIYTQNWSEEAFVKFCLKILLQGHMLLVILTVKILLERFKRKNCKNQIKKSLKLRK